MESNVLEWCACVRYGRWQRGLSGGRRREVKEDDPKRSGNGSEVGDEVEESKTWRRSKPVNEQVWQKAAENQ